MSSISDSQALMPHGFDDCIVGYQDYEDRLVYSKEKMIEKLCLEGFSNLEAIEHLEFNVWNSYIGNNDPVYIFTEHEILEEIALNETYGEDK